MVARIAVGLLFVVTGTWMLLGEEAAPDGSAERSVRQRLEQKVSGEFRRTPLHEAVKKLGDSAGVKVLIDRDALKQEGYTLNMPQSQRFENVAAREAVAAIVKQHFRMTFVVDEIGNRIVITTEAGAKRLQPPPADKADADAWRGLISAEDLAAALRRTRAELGVAVATPRAWRTRKGADRAAGRLVWLAEIAARHPEGLPADVAADLASSAARVQKATRSKEVDARERAVKAMEDVEATMRRHAESVGPRGKGRDRPQVELVDIMPRLERAYETLAAAAKGEAATGPARRRLAGEAALAAAAARLVGESPKYAGDAEFAAAAKGLSTSFAASRKAIDDGDWKGLRSGLASAVMQCTACHESFR